MAQGEQTSPGIYGWKVRDTLNKYSPGFVSKTGAAFMSEKKKRESLAAAEDYRRLLPLLSIISAGCLGERSECPASFVSRCGKKCGTAKRKDLRTNVLRSFSLVRMKGFSRRLANCPQDSLPRRCGAVALFKSSSPQDQTKSPEPKFGASVCLDVTKKIPDFMR